MRTVEIEDAEFIYNMRQIKDKVKYLSKVDGTIETQEKWIKDYKERENNKEEFYFILESKEKDKLGLVRMYDFKDNSLSKNLQSSFCWGSWLIKDNAPKTTAIESALQIYEFGFYTLGFEKSHFDVRKGNNKVIAFHKRFGAKIIDENDIEYYFDYQKKDYEITKEKYGKYL